MRIGSLTGLAIQKYDRTEPRDTVTKHIPGYAQTFNYDLVSTNPTIQVDGTLVGTSAANLASQISTLKAMHRNRKVVWIDASDQYQGLCDFVRISKLTGPTLDSSKGPLIATFSLEAIALLPWGTTLLNPYSTTGVVLRDLSGVGHENVLNPLSMNCNYTLSTSLQTNQGGNSSNWFSWEFIVDNQNAFSGSQTIINECENTTGWAIYNAGTSATFSNDGVIFKQGTYSLKCSATSFTDGTVNFTYTFTAVDYSAADFAVIWIRSDFGGSSTGVATVFFTQGGINYVLDSTRTCAANEWYRLVLPLRTNSNPSFTAVTGVIIQFTGPASTVMNAWVDEIAVDSGFTTRLEFQIPDNLLQGETTSLMLNCYAWNGSAYALWRAQGYGNLGSGGGQNGSFYYLDGSTMEQWVGAFGAAFWDVYNYAPIGTTLPGSLGVAGFSNAPITYSTTYGTNNRIAIIFKMPPATSDSQSGNYPSNDLSGFQAINKVRLKIVVYYSNEDTTYSGF